MRAIYFGVVTIVVTNHRHNRFFHILADSEDAALGYMIREARKAHPQGPIENTAVYPVFDELVKTRAAELA